ncbi:hypothetical protein [Xanthobacter aminoxidans]|uniref:hypothetical protein n=1 Tax=Xanthobacter aminoxidans TaxID=186280 RepID=UPI002022E6CB|nr:hypothetical protein [Xanthobacter aminoxidans]MCL8382078.1 hypothetical protein [Xanthobacter aminoxidans]
MRFDFVLGNGYPHPYPEGLSEEQQEEISGNLAVEDLRLKGVGSVEWRFEMTIQFVDRASYDDAKAATDWEPYDDRALILSVNLKGPEGRGEMPAIIVRDKAYCRWMLTA